MRCSLGKPVSTIVGGVATAVLHTLLISPLLFGGGHPPRALPDEQGGAVSGAQAMMVLDLHDNDSEPVEREAIDRLPDLASSRSALLPIGSIHLEADVPLAGVDSDADSSQSAAEAPQIDATERALIFGRYLGQVTARIDRAWLRPRTPIGSETFACRVRIQQDKDRNVEEIALVECNGTTAWQLSLVHAIDSASPLPAPPDPKVFSATLVFDMTADAFVEGGPTDGYEPVSRSRPDR